MSTYISSNGNRFYAALESAYGQAAAVSAANRYPAVRCRAHQNVQPVKRRDKTGTRTFIGNAANSRRQTAFETQTYLTSWAGTGSPAYGSLFQAALGGTPTVSSGLTVASTQGSLQFGTVEVHGLSYGCGVIYLNEVRFVTTVPDSQTFVVNAPFSQLPTQGSRFGTSITYRPGTELSSLSIYDYWDPITAVSRVIVGAAVDTLGISLNGDLHEFTFSGPAADLIDSCSFVQGIAGLASYPVEPGLETFDYSVVPGHLGEVWLGEPAAQFFTLTEASVAVKNNIEIRNAEYGSSYPMSMSAGARTVASRFTLFAQDDAQTIALYAAAKQRSPIPALLQLGQRTSQIMAVYMPQVVPEIPAYDDSESRLQWQFNNNVAQGRANDEIFIAFA